MHSGLGIALISARQHGRDALDHPEKALSLVQRTGDQRGGLSAALVRLGRAGEAAGRLDEAYAVSRQVVTSTWRGLLPGTSCSEPCRRARRPRFAVTR